MLGLKQYQEQFAQGQELAKMITPEVLNKNFDAEVVNSSIAGIRNGLREYIKNNPNAGMGQIQSEVQKQIDGISQWSNRVKAIKANIEETFKQMGQDKKVNKDRWMNAALTKALYKTNADGSKSIKGLLELERDPTYNFAADVWDTGGEAFIDISEISKDLEDSIKNSAKNKQNVTVTVGATKNKPGYTRTDNIEIPVWAEWDETKNKVTVKKQNGVIDNDVYTTFISGPEYDKFLNIKAKSALAAGEDLGVDPTEVFDDKGNIIDQTKFETAKKNWLTNYLEKFAPVTQTERDVTQPARMQVVVSTGGGAKTDTQFIDVVGEIKQYMEANPRKKGGYYQVNLLGDVAQGVVLKKAREATGINSIGVKDIRIENINGTPSIVVAQDIYDINKQLAYKKGQLLGSIGTQANISANQPLGTKAKQAAAEGSKQPTKTITKDAYRNMSLPERQKFLSSGGKVQ